MVENKQTEDDTIPYLKKLKELNSIHPIIQESISTLLKILEMRITPSGQTLKNLGHHLKIINTELMDEEFGMIYSNIDLLSIHLPNLLREEKNWNTLQLEERILLVDFLIEIVNKANKIKEKIIKEPVKQKDMMDEQEKTAFLQIQRADINKLKEVTTKLDFVRIKKIALDRCNTKEKKILMENIFLEFFGGKSEDIEWKQMGRKRKIIVKNAMH